MITTRFAQPIPPAGLVLTADELKAVKNAKNLKDGAPGDPGVPGPQGLPGTPGGGGGVTINRIDIAATPETVVLDLQSYNTFRIHLLNGVSAIDLTLLNPPDVDGYRFRIEFFNGLYADEGATANECYPAYLLGSGGMKWPNNTQPDLSNFFDGGPIDIFDFEVLMLGEGAYAIMGYRTTSGLGAGGF